MEEKKARMEVLREMQAMLRRETVLDDDGFAAAVVSCRDWMPWHSSVTISHGPWRASLDEEGDNDAKSARGGPRMGFAVVGEKGVL